MRESITISPFIDAKLILDKSHPSDSRICESFDKISPLVSQKGGS